MDRQSIYNRVRDHLLAQNQKAKGGCGYSVPLYRYQNKAGLKCAIGCLMPAGHPALNAQGGVHAMLQQHPDLERLWEVAVHEDINFLGYLQSIHDGCTPLEWPAKLREFAARQGLEA